MYVIQLMDETHIQDAFLPILDKKIHLSVFDGPLDLLLFLIKKNEIDIHDIPIEEVTQQYLKIIYNTEQLDLELAGEFFVMASTLMYIKSRMLLPKEDQIQSSTAEEEDIDPRWELVEQLLEYKKFKEITLKLEETISQKQDFIPRLYQKELIRYTERPLKNTDKIELWNLFNQVLRRLANEIQQGQISVDQVTVSSRMEAILSYMQNKRQFLFTELLVPNYSLNFLIATFLATLELCRLKKIKLKQSSLFEDIECYTWEDDNG